MRRFIQPPNINLYYIGKCYSHNNKSFIIVSQYFNNNNIERNKKINKLIDEINNYKKFGYLPYNNNNICFGDGYCFFPMIKQDTANVRFNMDKQAKIQDKFIKELKNKKHTCIEILECYPPIINWCKKEPCKNTKNPDTPASIYGRRKK